MQVIGLWVLFSLPVWSGAYRQAGGTNPEWFGISHVAEVLAHPRQFISPWLCVPRSLLFS